jgi:lipopolysaccharide export system permease protein
MGSIGRYIFRTTFGAFLVVLLSLTAVIWVTQALRDIDLMTNQGQTVLVFIGITGLIIPLLILVIAPIALVVAGAHVLNKLGTDSEIIVMNAAGMRPWGLFRPFLIVTVAVSIGVAFISAYLAPEGLRMLRRWLTEVRTDLVSNIVQPGRFTPIERGLTFHIRERRTNGLLVGIMLDDRRDEKERVTVLAEQGEIIKNERGSYLLLENGSIQRHEAKQRDPNLVIFDRYAFDLSQFTGSVQAINYSVRERYIWELISPDPNDPVYKSQPGQFRAEFHDRLLGPLYPFAFMIIAFTFLGAPRTTRQSRSWSMLAVIGNVALVRLVGFISTVLGVNYPPALALQYLAIAFAIGAGSYAIARGIIIEPPAFLTDTLTSAFERLVQQIQAKLKLRPAT